MRKLTLNEDYFSIIDCEAKAYFLGLLFADGYNNESTYQINIVLQEKDVDILLAFKKELGYGGELKYRDNTNKGRQNTYRLTLYSKKMSQDLTTKGCTKAKSLVLVFPSGDIVPKFLVRHFIRGYFDGDGCIYNHKSKRQKDSKAVSFVGTLAFLTSLQDRLMLECDLKTTKLAKHPKVYALHYDGNKQVPRIFNYLYKDASFFFERKHLKFKS